MKRIYSYILIASALIAAASCEKDNQVKHEEQGQKMVFSASYVTETESKTVMGAVDGTSAPVLWSGKESIKISNCDGTGATFERTDGEAESATAEFAGDYNTWENQENGIYALYPGLHPYFNVPEGVVFEDLAAEQTAKAGSFADTTMISIAKADENYHLPFRNVTGVIAFSLNGFSNVESVEFYGNLGEDLAGRMKIDLNSLSILTQENQKKSLILKAEEGSTLANGEQYYIVSTPQVLSNGFTVLVKCKGGKTYFRTSEKSNEIKRSKVLNLGELSQSNFTAIAVDELYIVGNAPHDCNWEIANARKMNKVADGVFKYGNRLIGGNLEEETGCYKFVLDKSNWEPAFVKGNENNQLRYYVGKPGNGDLKFNVQDDNAYTITVDLNNMTHTVEWIDPSTRMWLVGNASPFGWMDNNNAYDVELLATDETKTVFTWTGNLTTGELKISTELGNGWGGTWIYATSNGYEIGNSAEQTVGYDMRTAGDPDNKWKITTAGNYTVTVNTKNSQITFKKN